MCSQQYHRYVNKDREITKKFVQHAEKRGIKALFITVDAPQLGRREKVLLSLAMEEITYKSLNNAFRICA